MIFDYKDSCQTTPEEINISFDILKPYILEVNRISDKRNYEYFEGSINLPFDETITEEVFMLQKKMVSESLKYIFVVGIGGSNLGTKAVYDAMFGYTDNLNPHRFPKIYFMDTNDPKLLINTINFIQANVKSPEEILINTISKSGGTTETIANLEILLGQFDKYKSRVVITTDEGSKLWNVAITKNMPALSIPKKVGGRYSVFSSVGLFPLACAGINIKSLLMGAADMASLCVDSNLNKNVAAISASLLFSNYKNGKIINDTFVFHPELESLGKWYRQLMGESIGKEKDTQGNTINIGITPTASVGSADLHSVLQLYLGGPKNKYFNFITGENKYGNPKVPEESKLNNIVPEIKGKETQQIMSSILQGVKHAFKKSGIPFSQIDLGEINERSLGEFMQFKMLEIMYLAKLLNVNAFDQPNVESYKIETKSILQGN